MASRIIGTAPALAQATKLVRATHERGGGYPDGLAGAQIPLAPESSPAAAPSPP